MKKYLICILLSISLIFIFSGCSNNKETKEKNDNTTSMNSFVENEDGTFTKDNINYKYKIKLVGRENNAETNSWFEVLTNKKDITFHEVSWSLLSSQSSDFLDRNETVIIDLGVVEKK